MKSNPLHRCALAALALALSGGPSAFAAEALPGFKNPSIRVLVDERRPMPTSGTFGWGASVFRVKADPTINLVRVNERVQEALRTGFSKKGFVLGDGSSDYLVSFALAAGAEIDEAELNRTYGDFLRMPAAGTNASDNLAYKRGVLIVDLVDRQAKHLLWRGAILAEIDMSWPEARKQERCDAAVTALMRYFPHPPKARREESR